MLTVSAGAGVVVLDLARPVRESEQPALQFRFSEPLPSNHYTDPLFEVVDVLQRVCLQYLLIVRALRERGARLLLGTDTPKPTMLPGFSLSMLRKMSADRRRQL